MATVEFFYDISCPFAYLGSTQIQAVCKRVDATLAWRPILLGGVFRSLYPQTGAPPVAAAPKARLAALDLRRWAKHWGVPLTYPVGHPIRTVNALRALLVNPERTPELTHRLYRAYWVDHEDISDARVLGSILSEVGCDAEATLTEIGTPAVKDRLRAETDEALARGVFGVPAFFVDTDFMIWGQDRLPFVEAACRGWRPEED